MKKTPLTPQQAVNNWKLICQTAKDANYIRSLMATFLELGIQGDDLHPLPYPPNCSKLLDFARFTGQRLEADKDWDSDTTSAIGACAIELKLADNQGEDDTFRWLEDAKPAPRYLCDNCGSTNAPARALVDCMNLAQRLDPGSVVPAGECQCGSLTYLVTEDALEVALKRLLLCPALNEDEADPETREAIAQAEADKNRSNPNMQSTLRELDSLIERATRLRGYLEQRHGEGLGEFIEWYAPKLGGDRPVLLEVINREPLLA